MNRCKCGSTRIVEILAHCSDCFNAVRLDTGQTYNGYVPEGLGIGKGDDVQIVYCLDCGQIQNWEPQVGLLLTDE